MRRGAGYSRPASAAPLRLHLPEDPPAAPDPLEDQLLDEPGRRVLRVEPRRDADRGGCPVLAPGDLDIEVAGGEGAPEVPPGGPVHHGAALAIDLAQQVLTALYRSPKVAREVVAGGPVAAVHGEVVRLHRVRDLVPLGVPATRQRDAREAGRNESDPGWAGCHGRRG